VGGDVVGDAVVLLGAVVYYGVFCGGVDGVGVGGDVQFLHVQALA